MPLSFLVLFLTLKEPWHIWVIFLLAFKFSFIGIWLVTNYFGIGWNSADIWQNHRIGWMWYRCNDLVSPVYSLLRMFWVNFDHVVTLNGHCRNKLIFGGRCLFNYCRSTQPPWCIPPGCIPIEQTKMLHRDVFTRTRRRRRRRRASLIFTFNYVLSRTIW